MYVSHPRQGLDLLCVADLAAWTSFRMALVLPQITPDKLASSSYLERASTDDNQVEHFTPIGALIYYLSQRLAREDSALRDLADYYRITNIAGSAEGFLRLVAYFNIQCQVLNPVLRWVTSWSNDKAWD